MKLKSLFLSFVIFASSAAWAADYKVALVLDKGGKDDKSFNAAAFEGATRAQKELGVTVKTVEASDDNAFELLLRSFAQKKYDLIVSIGFAQKEAVRKIAPQFPSQKFLIVDSEVNAPNVRSAMFEEHEGSYVIGAIAALSSKTGKVGFIGGMDVPLIRRFQKGFEAGAKKINPGLKMVVNYLGVSADAWNNPPKAKELALSQYEGGVDVIFAAAGASGAGVFDAAEEKKKYAIGVDSNQNGVKPGFILTSMLKRVDLAVFNTVKEAKEGKFTAGTIRYGLADKGVDYAMDQYNDKLVPESVRKRAELIKAEIVAKKIQVPDYYKMAR